MDDSCVALIASLAQAAVPRIRPRKLETLAREVIEDKVHEVEEAARRTIVQIADFVIFDKEGGLKDVTCFIEERNNVCDRRRALDAHAPPESTRRATEQATRNSMKTR